MISLIIFDLYHFTNESPGMTVLYKLPNYEDE